MSEVTRLLLYLYAVFADTAESRLVLMRGRRAFDVFHKRVLPLIFNLFIKDDISRAEARKFDNDIAQCFRFIGDVQLQYFCQIRKIMHSKLVPMPGENEETVKIETLVARHKILSQLDGTQEHTPSIEEIKKVISVEFPLPDEMVTPLEAALENARDALADLAEFNRVCTKKDIQIWLAPEQVMGEFMAFLTHFSRAYYSTVHKGNDADPNVDISAGILHLLRAVLDMRKGIVMSTFRNRPELIPQSKVLELIRIRKDEVRLGPNNPKKPFLYKEETKYLLGIVKNNP